VKGKKMNLRKVLRDLEKIVDYLKEEIELEDDYSNEDSNDDEYEHESYLHNEYRSTQSNVPDYMSRSEAADNGYDVSDWDD
tara:strand:+ start:327 stop:569 length:243 start_codon:yes stop_codon:yes gene_type:complete